MPHKDPKEHRKYMKDYMKKWRLKNPTKTKEIDERAKKKLKLKVLNYLGGAKCKRCGCQELGILEINHVNLGGHKELEEKGYWNLLRDILKNKRKTEFEVLCRICNSAHYCEQKFNLKFDIKVTLA